MSLQTLFIINTTDFSSGIKAGSYSVYTNEVYKNFEDANGKTHRRYIRDRIEGSFKIFFRTMEQYNAFLDAINAVKSSTDSSVPITVYDLKAKTTKNINAFLDFKPVINLDGVLNPFIEPFEIKIEER